MKENLENLSQMRKWALWKWLQFLRKDTPESQPLRTLLRKQPTTHLSEKRTIQGSISSDDKSETTSQISFNQQAYLESQTDVDSMYRQSLVKTTS